MELIPVLNDKYEIDYYEHIEEKGMIKKRTIVIPDEEYFLVTEVIKNGNKVIFENDFQLDRELIEAVKSL